MKNLDNFYGSIRWKNLRARILRRDNYIDQLAKRYGKIIEANTVHHILPRAEYPNYQWESWNLIAISDKTHKELHDRLGDKLSKKGVELAIKVCNKQGIEYRQETIKPQKRHATYY